MYGDELVGFFFEVLSYFGHEVPGVSFTLAGDTLDVFWVNTYSFRSSNTLSILHVC